MHLPGLAQTIANAIGAEAEDAGEAERGALVVTDPLAAVCGDALRSTDWRSTDWWFSDCRSEGCHSLGCVPADGANGIM